MAKVIQTTLTINNHDSHQLQVNATINAALAPNEGWCWEVKKVNSVHLLIGDKKPIDITRSVMADPEAAAIVLACAADCDDQIYEALAEKEVVA